MLGFLNSSVSLRSAARTARVVWSGPPHPSRTESSLCSRFAGDIQSEFSFDGAERRQQRGIDKPGPIAACQGAVTGDARYAGGLMRVRRPAAADITAARKSRRRRIMAKGDSVYKIIEIVGVSKESWEAATRVAVEKASKTLRDLRVAEVVKLDVTVDEQGKVDKFRARLSVSFKYERE